MCSYLIRRRLFGRFEDHGLLRGLRRLLEELLGLFDGQRVMQHFIHVLDQFDIDFLKDLTWDVLQVLGVVPGNQDRFDQAPMGRQDLFLQSPDGKDSAAQGDFPVMAISLRAGMRVKADTMDVAMVMPADGPSLGIAPSGTCT